MDMDDTIGLLRALVLDRARFNEDMQREYGCVLNHAAIDFGDAFAPLLQNPANAWMQGHVHVNLAFLNGIRTRGTDCFLPQSIYVRNCMRQVFRLFARDAGALEDVVAAVPPQTKGTVLIGSPGVGKSVLCFLAALHRSRNMVTTYYRHTEARDEMVSVFIMFPSPQNTVDVLFTRTMERHVLRRDGLTGLNIFLTTTLGLASQNRYVFIDGPRHDDAANTLYLDYDYFCTSGGHPAFKNHASKSRRMWILDGWTKEEATAALGVGPRAAAAAYALCGGNIRDMFDSFTPRGIIRIRTELQRAIEETLRADIQLVILSSERGAGIRDRLRTMFRARACTNDDWMTAVQFVDSKFLLRHLRARLTLETFHAAYFLCQSMNSGAGRGLFFEHLVHQWFERSQGDLGITVLWTEGTAQQSVGLFVDHDVYWIPSIVNFPNIDSAIVLGDILYVFQMTIMVDHPFDMDTFEAEFVVPVVPRVSRVGVPVDSVFLFIVVPRGTFFRLDLFRNRLNRMHFDIAGRRIGFECGLHYVDMERVDRVSNSMETLEIFEEEEE
jgi:hypothetical protein